MKEQKIVKALQKQAENVLADIAYCENIGKPTYFLWDDLKEILADIKHHQKGAENER